MRRTKQEVILGLLEKINIAEIMTPVINQHCIKCYETLQVLGIPLPRGRSPGPWALSAFQRKLGREALGRLYLLQGLRPGRGAGE